MARSNGRRKDRWRRLVAHWRLAMHTRATPEQIGMGAAIGLFCGFVLPPGVQLLPAMAVAQIAGAHVPAAALATFVSNPLTMPFIYPFAAWLGSHLTGIPLRTAPPEGQESFWRMAADPAAHRGRMLMMVIVGNLVMGSLASLAGYSGFIRLARWRRARKHKKIS